MINRLQRALEQFRRHKDDQINGLNNESRRFMEENEKLKRELEEYKKRHPASLGVKNGKSYEIRSERTPQVKVRRDLELSHVTKGITGRSRQSRNA